MKNKYFFVFFWTLASLCTTFGQKFQYALYQGGELPFQKVNQVVQDARGYMWLATDQGLFRFNGTDFEDFNVSLRSRYIKSIIAGPKGSLLFSNDTGVHQLHYETDRVRIADYLKIAGDKGDLGYPQQLFMDATQRLWIGQVDGSVFTYQSSGRVRNKLSLDTPNKTDKTTFGEDRFGNVWVLAPGEGLFYEDGRRQRMKRLEQFKDMRHFYMDGDQLYLVGERIIILKVDQNRRILEQTLVPAEETNFSHIGKDLAGTFFLASEAAIYTLTANEDGLGVQKVFGSNTPHRIDELPYSAINHLYFSQDQIRPGGLIWVSMSTGLGLMSTSYFQSISGMSFDNVFSLSALKDSEVLISQSNVSRAWPANRGLGFEKVEAPPAVMGISAFNANIWLGTADGKIDHYRNDRLTATYDLTDRGGGIFFMYADHTGDNWFCQAPADKPILGVAKIGIDGEVVLYDDKKGLNSRVLVVKEGGKSELYAAGIGLKSYLYKYNRDTDTFENKSLPFPFRASSNFEVHDIAVDRRGMVWLGTTDGLLRYDTEHIKRIDLGPLTKTEVRSVCTMAYDGLWLATDTAGLVHLNKNEDYVIFDEKSGTPSKVTSYRSLVLDANQKLWVGTAEGAVYSSHLNPVPLLTAVPVLGEVKIGDRPIKNRQSIRFSETEVAHLKFTSIIYPGEGIGYQHKIYRKDLSEDEVGNLSWSVPSETPEIKVQGLAGGSYKVLVRAQKSGGYAWSIPAEIDIRIRKKWYKTWWGMLLLLGLAGLLFWYYLRLWVFKKTQNLEASLSKKQQQLKHADTNIDLMDQLLKEIPKRAPWDIMLPILAKLVKLPTGIDAFELAFKKGGEVHYKGYVRGAPKLMVRKEEFNEKEHLASYALMSNNPINIGDFEKEVGQYVNEKESRGYLSRILIPFEQIRGTEAVFCVYRKKPGSFNSVDGTLLQILTTFLSTNAIDELK